MDWVDLLVVVYAGQDEEDAGPLGAAVPQPPQPEDDRPLVLLHHLGNTTLENIALHCTIILELQTINRQIFGCESSPISPNVRSSVS